MLALCLAAFGQDFFTPRLVNLLEKNGNMQRTLPLSLICWFGAIAMPAMGVTGTINQRVGGYSDNEGLALQRVGYDAIVTR